MSSPTLDEPADPDLIGLVFRALVFGAALGVALQALVTWTVRTLQGPTPPETPRLSSGPALVLLLGTLGAIVAAAVATGKALTPIRNPWRQVMLGLIAGLGSFVLALVTIPLDRGFGRPGLLGLALVSASFCWWTGRRLAIHRRGITG